jgi:XTP/dITP diphosphohydrolase
VPDLLLATNNGAKVAEFSRMLAGSGWTLRTPREVGFVLDVEESGSTYAENANLKAYAAARRSGLVALGDDSGIEVDALGGAPGLLSARYAGSPSDDAANRDKLLSALAGASDRRARFRCFLVVAAPSGEGKTFEGTVEGTIAEAERGDRGFGYDPLFVPLGYVETVAELSPSVKDRLSHRGRALQAALPYLAELLRNPPIE